jgi:hypothetical protein
MNKLRVKASVLTACEFNSHFRHGCLSVSLCAVLLCIGRGLASGLLLAEGVEPAV